MKTINGYDIHETATGGLYIAVDENEDMEGLLAEVRRELPDYDAAIDEMGISLEPKQSGEWCECEHHFIRHNDGGCTGTLDNGDDCECDGFAGRIEATHVSE